MKINYSIKQFLYSVFNISCIIESGFFSYLGHNNFINLSILVNNGSYLIDSIIDLFPMSSIFLSTCRKISGVYIMYYLIINFHTKFLFWFSLRTWEVQPHRACFTAASGQEPQWSALHSRCGLFTHSGIYTWPKLSAKLPAWPMGTQGLWFVLNSENGRDRRRHMFKE